MTEMTSAHDWRGRTLKDCKEETIGKIDAVRFDEQTDRPEWALVDTGPFGSKSSFVPLVGASSRGEDVVAQVDAQQVKDAPKMDAEGELSDQQEAELFRHYGGDYCAGGSVTATANGHTTGSRPADHKGQEGI